MKSLTFIILVANRVLGEDDLFPERRHVITPPLPPLTFFLKKYPQLVPNQPQQQQEQQHQQQQQQQQQKKPQPQPLEQFLLKYPQLISNEQQEQPKRQQQQQQQYLIDSGSSELENNQYLQAFIRSYIKERALNYTDWFFDMRIEKDQLNIKPYLRQTNDRNALFQRCPGCLINTEESILVDFYKNFDVFQNEDSFSASTKNMINMQQLLNKSSTKEQVGSLLYRGLGQLGLLVSLHKFKYRNYTGVEAEGVNLVGVLPSPRWGTRKDKVFIISSPWEQESDEAGAIVLLEAARGAIKRAGSDSHSVLFVLFDKTQDGAQGSKFFVSGFLETMGLTDKVEAVFNLEPSSGESNPGNKWRVVHRDRLGEQLALRTLLATSEVGFEEQPYPQLQGISNMSPEQILGFKEVWKGDASRFWTIELAQVLSIQYPDSNEIENFKSVAESLATFVTFKTPTKSLQNHTETTTQMAGSLIPDQISELKLMSTLASFLGTLVTWQQNIDERVNELKELNQAMDTKLEAIRWLVDLQKNMTSLEVRPHYSVEGDLPYLVLGQEATNLTVLQEVIKDYYSKKTPASATNSPMIIKIVPPK